MRDASAIAFQAAGGVGGAAGALEVESELAEFAPQAVASHSTTTRATPLSTRCVRLTTNKPPKGFGLRKRFNWYGVKLDIQY